MSRGPGTPRRTLVLVVDDDEAVRATASSDLEDAGIDCELADSVESALALVARRHVDVVLLDIALPLRSGGKPDRRAGIEVIAKLRAASPAAEIIMLSGHDCAQAGMDAVREGASDFIVKPYHPPEQLLSGVVRALERAKTRSDAPAHHDVEMPKSFVSGRSPAMREVMRIVEATAATDATVLLTGETGTGKEMIARAIHARSLRKDGPFVAVNVAAVPRELVESTLFGHERGAFTGATQSREGRFESARGGTLLLDEIGDLEGGAQVKLLRVLQEEEFERVGGSRTIRADVRIVAATNRDLREEVRNRLFREDLYFRLAVVPIALPPLRDRVEDLDALLACFLERYARRYGKPAPGVAPEASAVLRQYQWPGNVRELEHLAQRLVVLKPAGVPIRLPDLPIEYRCDQVPLERIAPSDAALREALLASERDAVLRALERCRGNRYKAAALLGIHPATLFRKLSRYRTEQSRAPQPPGLSDRRG